MDKANQNTAQFELPPEPEKPLRDDCCGGGSCCPCIWDVYFEKLDKWREQVRAIKQKQNE